MGFLGVLAGVLLRQGLPIGWRIAEAKSNALLRTQQNKNVLCFV